MELLEALDQMFGHTTSVVAGVGADRLAAPTPCDEWDVRTLIAHTMGVVANMGRGAAGEELLANPNDFVLAADLTAQFRSTADQTYAAWMGRGLDGVVDVGAGPMPVRAAISVNLVDTSAHTWDIARATGQDEALPDELARTVLAVAQGLVTDDIRKRVGIDPPLAIAQDASPTDQFVAFMGRRP